MGIPLTDEVPPESTGETTVGFEHWLTSKKDKIAAIFARYRDMNDSLGQSVVEISVTTNDGAQKTHRIPLGEGKVLETARTWIADLEKQTGLSIPLAVG